MTNNNGSQDKSEMARLFKKAFRIFAAIIFLIALMAAVRAFLNLFYDRDTDFSFLVIIIFFILSFMLWKLPDRINEKYYNKVQDEIKKASYDARKEVIIKNMTFDNTIDQYVEISDKDRHIKHIMEDRHGNIIFDNTRRPFRLIAGGLLTVFLLITGILVSKSSEYYGFLGFIIFVPGILFGLGISGYIHEVRINKNLGTADREKGWFFILSMNRFFLKDFNEIFIGATIMTDEISYDSLKERFPVSNAKVSIYLVGEKILRLKSFFAFSDARQTGNELSAYLHLPVKEVKEFKFK